MNRTNLNNICEDLELIIEGLTTGKEIYREEDTRYSLEEALNYLREYLQELKDLNVQIIDKGNTPELLKKVHDKYTELWLFQLFSQSIAFLVLLTLCGVILIATSSLSWQGLVNSTIIPILLKQQSFSKTGPAPKGAGPVLVCPPGLRPCIRAGLSVRSMV